MSTNKLVTQEQLAHFFHANTGNRLALQLLGFWSRHPDDAFTSSTIRRALDYGKQDIEQVLMEMVAAGLVKITLDRGTPLYSLTSDEKRRQLIMNAAYFARDWQATPRHAKKGKATASGKCQGVLMT